MRGLRRVRRGVRGTIVPKCSGVRLSIDVNTIVSRGRSIRRTVLHTRGLVCRTGGGGGVTVARGGVVSRRKGVRTRGRPRGVVPRVLMISSRRIGQALLSVVFSGSCRILRTRDKRGYVRVLRRRIGDVSLILLSIMLPGVSKFSILACVGGGR